MPTEHYPRDTARQSAEVAEQLLKLLRREPYIDDDDANDIRTALRAKPYIDCLKDVDEEAWLLHRSVWLFGAADLLRRLSKTYGSSASEPAAIAIVRNCLYREGRL